VAEFNPALAKLEDPILLRSRALILENKDGFDNPPVLRAPPPMINLDLTAPYALSFPGVTTVAMVAVGATKQHFTKNIGGDPDNITRVDGEDFTLPTLKQAGQIEAFLLSIFLPTDEIFDLDRFATSPAQLRGQALFFSADGGKCSFCHSVPDRALAFPDANQPFGGDPPFFNTGVANLEINRIDQLPRGDIGREFNVPPLFGVSLTPPFFHDNSVTDLRDAVTFYQTGQFTGSPAGQQTGVIGLNAAEVDDIVAFLESLVEPP